MDVHLVCACTHRPIASNVSIFTTYPFLLLLIFTMIDPASGQAIGRTLNRGVDYLSYSFDGSETLDLDLDTEEVLLARVERGDDMVELEGRWEGNEKVAQLEFGAFRSLPRSWDGFSMVQVHDAKITGQFAAMEKNSRGHAWRQKYLARCQFLPFFTSC